MTRLLSLARWDMSLQFRNGFYYVSAFAAVFMIVLLKQFEVTDFGYWWPAIITGNLTINAFYFMAGLVLLEKAEGTLEAQIVTPLRPWEILGSKGADARSAFAVRDARHDRHRAGCELQLDSAGNRYRVLRRHAFAVWLHRCGALRLDQRFPPAFRVMDDGFLPAVVVLL
jgi:hypothetical protein